jgi:thioredoxin-dependent peroxiredoxin
MPLEVIKPLRTIALTLGAIATGIVNTLMHDGEKPVELKPGDEAPDFTLPGSDGRTYRLKELAGQPVVIAWFPKAFTGGCTAECKSLRENSDPLRRLKVRHFAASVDSVEQNARFAASLDLDYPVLSDPTKAVARAYGVLAPSGFASRWTFYIGADGRILDIDKKVSYASHGTDVLSALTNLTS